MLALVVGLTATASTLDHRPGSSLPPLPTPPPTDFLASDLAALPSLDEQRHQRHPMPDLPAAEVDAMIADAIVFASLHGMLVHARAAAAAPASDPSATAPASSPRLLHVPFSLLPASFPAEQLDLATTTLPPLFGLLVERAGRDHPWLTQALRQAAQGDDFTRRLLKLATQVEREGSTQPARLAILRSDYMLHEPEGSHVGSGRLLQVELNTIAASFAGLACRVGELHTRLAQRWAGARRHVWLEAGKPETLSLREALPPSDAIRELAASMAQAHTLYGGPRDAVILFVVQPGESNELDQQLLAEELWEGTHTPRAPYHGHDMQRCAPDASALLTPPCARVRSCAAHGIRVVRRTLAHIAHEARLAGAERKLMLQPTGLEVALVYFRAGYTPDDYPTGRQWDARATLERSHAIKCPCIQHHLVGCKKVQQQLALPGELERFMSVEEATSLRTVFAGLWSLSGPTEPSDDATAEEHVAAMHMRLAMEKPSEYVMKPQREGGGHNYFGDELKQALGQLSRAERAAFILMQRIRPRRQPAVLVRDGEATVGPAASELGVYSTLLTSGPGSVLLNQAAGHLVRTKLDGVDEGGVAAGYAVLSSPLAAGMPSSAKKKGWFS